MAFSQQLSEHFEHPRNVGSLDEGDACVGSALIGSPQAGEVIRLQVRVNPDTGVIDAARFKTYGSSAAIAASSLATVWLQGRATDAALQIGHADLARELALPPERLHSAMRVTDAIHAAISNYRAKHGNTTT